MLGVLSSFVVSSVVHTQLITPFKVLQRYFSNYLQTLYTFLLPQSVQMCTRSAYKQKPYGKHDNHRGLRSPTGSSSVARRAGKTTMHKSVDDHPSDPDKESRRVHQQRRDLRKGGCMIALFFTVLTVVLFIGREEIGDLVAWVLARITR